MIRLNYAVQTHQGKIRENNEDNFYWNGKIRADVNVNQLCYKGVEVAGQILAAVCDGMGGEAHGERASLMAVQTLKPCSVKQVQKTALASIQMANAKICDEIEKNNGKRMGTTLAALYIENDKAVCCNVGDSRVYWLHEGKFTQLSVDHNRVSLLVAEGILTQEEARRNKNRHILTQYLGIFEEEMIIKPAFSEEITLDDGDIFLLCSDGLTDMVPDEEIVEILQIGKSEEQVERLVERALEHGGKDNITAIVCQVEIEKQKSFWHRLVDKRFLRHIGNSKIKRKR